MNNNSKQQTVVWIALIITGIVVIAGFAINSQKKEVPKNLANSSLENIIKSSQTWGPDFTTWYGMQSPDFTVTDINGDTHKLSNYRGKNVLVVFWATWCPACNQEIPHLIELRKTHPDDELEILAISNESSDELQEFVASKGINYNVVSLTSALPEPFISVSSIPTTFFIDPDGMIKLAAVGLVSLEESEAIMNAN